MLLPLLQSDLYEVIMNTMNGKLAFNAPVWHQDSSAVTVVMASGGYPGSYKKGVEITGTGNPRFQQESCLKSSESEDGVWLHFFCEPLSLYMCKTLVPFSFMLMFQSVVLWM